ncbi:hypothetical protein [Azospirillum brasilense]|uniref:hypothetical protein n=1 Tax=Azospirillum brasilense TaxID=192 RepID=UPI0011EDBC0A|nr:hypothetical protein [Azospirillum brasilense]
MDQASAFSQMVIASLGGDLKVVLAIIGFIVIAVISTLSRSEIIKERAFEIVVLCIICPTIIIIAVQKEPDKNSVYVGLLGTLIGYLFNVGRSGVVSKESPHKRNHDIEGKRD